MKLSPEFYDQLNSIENFKELDYNDPQVAAIRMRADHEFESMETARMKENADREYVRANRIIAENKISPPDINRKESKRRPFYVYELYYGKKLVGTGTAKELGILTGFSEKYISAMGTPKWLNKIDRNKQKYALKVGIRK